MLALNWKYFAQTNSKQTNNEIVLLNVMLQIRKQTDRKQTHSMVNIKRKTKNQTNEIFPGRNINVGLLSPSDMRQATLANYPLFLRKKG